MNLSDSDIGSNNIVTWDIVISQIRQGTGEIVSDRDTRHWHFLKSTCNIRTPYQGPQNNLQTFDLIDPDEQSYIVRVESGIS